MTTTRQQQETNFMKIFQFLSIGLASIFLASSSALAADAPAGTRRRLLMDTGWHFTFKDPGDAAPNLFDYPETPRLHKALVNDDKLEAALVPQRVDAVETNLGAQLSYVQPGFDDSQWRVLDLPHDWAVELPFDKTAVADHGFKALGKKWGTNIGWYRRTFALPAEDKDKAVWIEFDGVYRNSLVWLNGHCLGRNVSGYSSFSYDLNKYANFGGKNTLVVRADATRPEGWFYEGAGIYRHVWLMKTAPLHVAKWGTYVTSEVHGTDADTNIQTDLRNDSDQSVTCNLISTIHDTDGKVVGEAQQDSVVVGPHQTQTVAQKITIDSVHLWDLESPFLYRLETNVKGTALATDTYETNFGVRTLKFDPEKGFFLNGKRVQIQGTCNHQDYAGVGWAVPDALLDFRLKTLQAVGSNAYRMSHNPPCPELLDRCDKVGMLVIDEQRKMGTSPEILSQVERMVVRDRNHPSIFIWSIGNEEMAIEGKPSGIPVATTMQDLVHKLDPTRPVTAAMNLGWEEGFSKVVDVQGFNYLKQGDMDKFHKDFPLKPAIGTEEASTETTRGIYAVDKKNCYYPAYDVTVPKWGSTAEAWMQYYAARPWVEGAFVWSGFDYRGEPKPYGFPSISCPMGLMDICGFPKDTYYFYKANWTNQPVIHLLPHWNWTGKEGRDIDVWCYTNMDEVELFLNGKSLGRQKVDVKSHEEWKVPFEPGTLFATGYRNGQAAGKETIETTGAPATIKLIPDRAMLKGDGEDVSVVTVQVLDAQGRIVPIADNQIAFNIKGGKIIGVANGNSSSLEPDQATQRKAFNGLAQVIVQSMKQAGEITLSATSDGLKSDAVTITSDSSGPRPSVP
jgi:beta-galactosidase